jgi:hypothetical protein
MKVGILVPDREMKNDLLENTGIFDKFRFATKL